jgi:hypothetical protein
MLSKVQRFGRETALYLVFEGVHHLSRVPTDLLTRVTTSIHLRYFLPPFFLSIFFFVPSALGTLSSPTVGCSGAELSTATIDHVNDGSLQGRWGHFVSTYNVHRASSQGKHKPLK